MRLLLFASAITAMCFRRLSSVHLPTTVPVETIRSHEASGRREGGGGSRLVAAIVAAGGGKWPHQRSISISAAVGGVECDFRVLVCSSGGQKTEA